MGNIYHQLIAILLVVLKMVSLPNLFLSKFEKIDFTLFSKVYQMVKFPRNSFLWSPLEVQKQSTSKDNLEPCLVFHLLQFSVGEQFTSGKHFKAKLAIMCWKICPSHFPKMSQRIRVKLSKVKIFWVKILLGYNLR